MNIKILFISLLIFINSIYASEHGIYLLTNSGIKSDISAVESRIINELMKDNFKILHSIAVTTPDYVRENKDERLHR